MNNLNCYSNFVFIQFQLGSMHMWKYLTFFCLEMAAKLEKQTGLQPRRSNTYQSAGGRDPQMPGSPIDWSSAQISI